jgi:hypothetical protein
MYQGYTKFAENKAIHYMVIMIMFVLGYFIYGKKIYTYVYFQLLVLLIGVYIELRTSGFLSG